MLIECRTYITDSITHRGYLELWWVALDGEEAWVYELGPGKVCGPDANAIPETLTDTFEGEMKEIFTRRWKPDPTCTVDPDAVVGIGAREEQAPDFLRSDMRMNDQ